MNGIIVLFWILVFIVFYAYIGYGILLFLLVVLKRVLGRNKEQLVLSEEFPEVTLFITAYNERDYVVEKMNNTFELDYPKDKLQVFWVTDGSDDGTPELVQQYVGVTVLHQPERRGKIAAMNRGMHFVTTPIVVFCDANTMLGKESISRIVRLLRNPKVGCVSGEKRIFTQSEEGAAAAGEGLYWKYESKLKKWDAELHSVVGAAGELFAIRTALYREVEPDTLLDDFVVSLRVAQEGYLIQYDPEAYAIESSSANVKEELKRKIRISAGGIQSIVRLRSLLNVFKYGTLSFQYISHRVLRWTVAPLSLPFILITNYIVAASEGFGNYGMYEGIFFLQLLFYAMALLGWFLENKKIRIRVLFVPYYFFIMNLSVYLGFIRYIKGKQSVNWERAKRNRTA